MTLQEIANFLQISFEANAENNVDITALSSIKEAKKGELSFVVSRKYIPLLAQSQASAVLVRAGDLQEMSAYNQSIIPLVCDDPHVSIAHLSKLFAKPPFRTCKESSYIDESATIMERVSIGSGVRIGKHVVVMSGVVIGDGVCIGDDCLIYPNVVLYRDTILHNRVIIHAGAVIGSDGFGYARCRKTGENIKIYHNGIVRLDDDVEIGANTTIDRAVFGQTHIKRGTKIDNLVQVGHNCIIGECSLIAGQAGLAGSTTTGRNVVMGGQSGAAGHLHIGDFATLTVRSTASKSLAAGKIFSGYPTCEHKEWLKMQAKVHKFFKVKR